jgi:hypothetical protein
VAAADAWRHARWVTAANDFGVYDLRYADNGSNVRSKGIDGFTPLGAVLLDARAVDPERIRLRTWVNGKLAQDAVSGDNLLFSFADIVADISRLTTLEPGDVILTGTPTGSSVVKPGDVVEVEVSSARPGEEPGSLSTGRLRTPVQEAGYDLSPPAEYGATLPGGAMNAQKRAVEQVRPDEVLVSRRTATRRRAPSAGSPLRRSSTGIARRSDGTGR